MRVKDRPSVCYVCGCKIYHDIEPSEWMRGARYFECGNHFVFGNPPKPNGWANGCFYLTGTFNKQRARIAVLEAQRDKLLVYAHELSERLNEEWSTFDPELEELIKVIEAERGNRYDRFIKNPKGIGARRESKVREE